MKKAVFFAVLFLSSTVNYNQAYSFDNVRKGFILGGGLGVGWTSYTQTVETFLGSSTSDRENKGAFMTDFKIGFAPSEQVELYWTSKVSWFGFENAFGNNVTVAFGLGGLGISYYLNPLPPTVYLSGGVGYSSWGLPFEDNAPSAWIGGAIYGGVGYEFARHYSVEGDLYFGNPSDSEFGVEARTDGLTFKITVNALAY